MAFYVGQRIECIRDDNDVFGREMIIKKGSIYTVASLVTSNWGRDGVTLVEVEPPPGVVGWLNELFRPIVERKTDISIFKAMLNPSKTEVTA